MNKIYYMRFLTGFKKLKIRMKSLVFSRPMKFNLISYRWPIAVSIFSLIFIAIQFKYFEAEASINVLDVLAEGSAAVMLFVALFIVGKLQGNSRVYILLGMTLLYFAFFVDTTNEFFNQADYFKYLFEDALQILGTALFVFGVWRWVTNKNLTENKLRESEQQLKNIFDDLDIVFFSKDITNNKLLRISPACEKVCGQSPQEFFKNPSLWMEIIHPDDKSIMADAWSNLDSGKSAFCEYRIIRSDGKIRWVEGKIIPTLDTSGALIRVDGIVTDVTERKEVGEKLRILKEKYENLYENSPIMCVSLNVDGIIIECNKTILDKLGYAKREFADKHMAKFTTKESAASFKKDFSRLLETRKLLGVERQLVTKGGKIIDVILNVTMEYDENQKPISTKATFEDITDRKKAEEKLKIFSEVLEGKVKERTGDLQIVNKNLERANEIKADFIADASHELRTPLSIIKLNLDLALRESSRDSTDPYEAMATIHNEVGLMSNIISDLTFLSRADAGDVSHLRYRDIQLGELLTRVVKSTRVMSEKKNISLYIDNLDEIYVRGDEAALERLFMNLISNAVKYNHDNGWVRLTLTNDDKYAVITVTDNGIGISDEDLLRVFERFYRADKARSRESGGTGLGLSISKWVAEVHGGTINVKSEIGKGSEFTVKLPLSGTRT